MKNISLRTKFLVVTVGIPLLLGLSVIVFVHVTLSRKLHDELTVRGIPVARSIAKVISKPIKNGQIEEVRMSINDFKDFDSDIAYIFITGLHNEVLAHTFKEEFPVDLKEVNKFSPGQKYNIQCISVGNETIHDVAVPISKNGSGVVHLGLSEGHINEAVYKKIIEPIVGVIAIVLAVGIVIVYASSAKITAPLYEILKAARTIGSGNLEQKVPIKTMDEIGRLGSVFNQMAEDLSRTLVSKEVLNQSYEFTKTILNSMNDAILIVDVNNFRIVGVNSVFLREFGLREEEVIGQTCYEITHKRSDICRPPDNACPLIDTVATGKHTIVEHVHYGKDGEKIYVEVTTSPIKDENGNVIQVVHVSRNIRERKLAEMALRESKEELLKKHEELIRLFKYVESVKKEWERTMDCVGDMIVLIDNQGKIKRCNRTLKEFTGKSYEEIIGKDWGELLLEQGIETGTLYGQGTELFHEPTGRWFVLNSYPFKNINNSEISGNVITIHDSTEIKEITQELERKNEAIDENRNKLQLALDKISSLILQVAEEKGFNFEYKNPELEKCYEVKKCTKNDCPCYGKEAMRCWQIVGTYCGGGIRGYFAEKYKNCSECVVFKMAASDPICQIGEHFSNMMYILESKNEKLEEAYVKLKDTQTKILQSEKMASIGQLAAGVAHEINNPIGFISSNLGTLIKYVDRFTEFINTQTVVIESLGAHAELEELNEKRKQLKLDHIISDTGELIKESLDGTDRVKKIVQDLKSFSRVDEAENKMADINLGLDSTINIVWNELKYKVKLKKEYGDIPVTRCNPGQLNQVFMNMLINAAHAIEKQGEITVRTWNNDGMIFVSISDTGCGIPKDKINKIFEPFFTTKEVGKGTGLGLSIAYDIIKKHNGEINVESEIGKGTIFTVKIPIMEGK